MNSSALLKETGGIGNSLLGLRVQVLRLPPESMVVATGFSWVLFIGLGELPSISNLLGVLFRFMS